MPATNVHPWFDDHRLNGAEVRECVHNLVERRGLPTKVVEHIVERTRSTDYPPEYGIDMNIPEHLYNQGEVYNLSISRGTLKAKTDLAAAQKAIVDSQAKSKTATAAMTASKTVRSPVNCRSPSEEISP